MLMPLRQKRWIEYNNFYFQNLAVSRTEIMLGNA